MIPSNLRLPQSFALRLFPRNVQRPNSPTKIQQKLLDSVQAGIGGGPGGNLIDQSGHLVYYAIHVNPEFLHFLQQHNLTTVAGIRNIDQSLTFLGSDAEIQSGVNTNVIEFKSAWMIVDPVHPPADYFVVPAQIPHYIVANKSLVQESRNGNPVFDSVNVALIALHVVFTLPGHPEMIWSTFEHVKWNSGKFVRDNAPATLENPSKTSPDAIVSSDNFPLYKGGTPISQANNKAPNIDSLIQFWDSRTQSFRKADGTAVGTSVYRPYPGSKTDGSPANPGHSEDDEVIQMNDNATIMFTDAKTKGVITDADKRQNYRLVGATWLDQPVSGPNPTFKVGQRFVMDNNQSTDDDGQAIAGEGRLGSTAMESFTEFEDGAPSCFSCHDTSDVRDKRVLVKAARLNVSHILSKFMDSQPPPAR